jgi:tetratricopeptide (TPR) repeat protein
MKHDLAAISPCTTAQVGLARRVLASLGQLAMVALAAAPLAGCGSLAARGMNAQGVRCFEQARYEDSLAEFQRAVQNDPNNADGYYNLGAVYHRTAALNKRPADFEQAERYYNQCLDHNADHVECHRGLAVLLVQQGRNQEAFRLIEGWADRRADLAEPKIELARLLEETGDRAAAKQKLVDALALDPNHPRALTALGHLQETSGEQAQAMANYQRSLWNDRFQPEVAARIASLLASLPGAAVVAAQPSSSTEPRMVSRGTGTMR